MGLAIDAISETDAVQAVIESAAGGRGGWVITPNLEQLRRFVTEPELRALFEEASLILADGTTLVWASRLQGTPLPERVPGSTLLFTLSRAASQAGLSVFLLGGNPGTAVRAASVLRQRFPGLRIAGTLCPELGSFPTPAQLNEMTTALRDSGSHIVYVCLGFPKQERVIRALRPAFPEVWFLGLGVSLSFAAGEIVRAPLWVQRLGAEWLHRLVQEPRLFGRFVIHGIPFSLSLLLGAAHQRFLRKAGASPPWRPVPSPTRSQRSTSAGCTERTLSTPCPDRPLGAGDLE